MTIGILIQHAVPFYKAMEYVAEVRPCLMPNFKIVHLLDEYFGLDGKFVNHFQEWRRRAIQLPFEIRPSVASVDNMKNLLRILNP